MKKFIMRQFTSNKFLSVTDILIILLIFLLKSCLINFMLLKTFIKLLKQLLIILPFLGHLSFITRNRLNRYIRNQLPSCSLIIAFQSKTHLSSLSKFKDSIPKYLHSHLIDKFSCGCFNATYYGETERHLFVSMPKHLGITPLKMKQIKNPKKSAIMDHILLDKQELNRTIETFTPILQRFLHNGNSYCNIYFCIIRIIALLKIQMIAVHYNLKMLPV